MQPKTLLTTLFIAIAAAHPSPAESTTDITQGTEKNAFVNTVDTDMSTLAQKNWQAAGGCKTDWDEDNRCLSTCIGEANSKCIGWKSMTAVIQGGCVWGWNTCRCVCEY